MSRRWASCFAVWLLASSVGMASARQDCPWRHGMWVYTGSNHPDVVHSDDARNALLTFAGQHCIGEIFLRTQMNCADTPDGPMCQIRPDDVDGVNQLLAAVHQQQPPILVHALRDGVGDVNPPDTPIWSSAELALNENHPRVMALVQAVLDFNASGGEQFDGVHLDIEPYTLTAYRTADDDGKIEIIRQFLVLNKDLVAALTPGNVTYGIDIGPGWHGFEPQPNLWMAFDGQNNYPTMHLLNMVKQANLMVYLNDAARIIDKDRPVIEYANGPGVNASVRLGVQTCPGRDGTFGGGTQTDMELALGQVSEAFAPFGSYKGFSYFNYTCYRLMPE